MQLLRNTEKCIRSNFCLEIDKNYLFGADLIIVF